MLLAKKGGDKAMKKGPITPNTHTKQGIGPNKLNLDEKEFGLGVACNNQEDLPHPQWEGLPRPPAYGGPCCSGSGVATMVSEEDIIL